ncbi:MAG: hypothetical protein HQK51_04605 [Oligoflexia bacterium]|nr:hypothetical protein [Oligoflexia bacterium]
MKTLSVFVLFTFLVLLKTSYAATPGQCTDEYQQCLGHGQNLPAHEISHCENEYNVCLQSCNQRNNNNEDHGNNDYTHEGTDNGSGHTSEPSSYPGQPGYSEYYNLYL